jgi:hypothetical protein
MVVEERCSASVLSQSHVGWPHMYPPTSSLEDVLAYDTAFHEEYLLAQGIFATREEARAAIVACKKFLYRAVQFRSLDAVSDLVDAAWHAWILHTQNYMTFCHDCFGRYIHHVPIPAYIPPAVTTDARCRTALEQYGHDGGHGRAACVR